MADFEDYYEMLQVHFLAEPEIIKAAYKRLALKYTPDVNKSPDATARMVRINAAYAILSDPDRRKQYDPEWIKRKQGPQRPGADKPKPTVEPNHIQFTDIKPNEVKQASFLILNAGGSYKKIWFSDPKSWVRIVNYFSLTNSDELPLKVEIEAQGYDWDKDYLDYIKVRLDDEETEVRIGLRTEKKKSPPPPPPSPRPSFSPRKRNATKSNWWKAVVGIGLIILVIIVATQFMHFSSGSTNVQPPATLGQPTPPTKPPLPPTPPPPIPQPAFREIDISAIAKQPLDSNFPRGNNNFNGVDFNISQAFMTQYGAGSLPEEGSLSMDIAHPVTLYILINSDNTYPQFSGKQAGKITLIFDNGLPEETKLVVGQNIREYTQDVQYGNTVRTVTDPASQVAWRGSDPPRTIAIDMLTIPVINQLRSLKQVIITDTSKTATNSSDPGLIVWGLTIKCNE